jgi:alpha-pyrone synthase
MNIFINRIGIAVPNAPLAQSQISRFMQRYMARTDEDARKIAALFRLSGIRQRHSVIKDYGQEPEQFEFYPANESLSPFPGTEQRMITYRQHALPLALQAIKPLHLTDAEKQAVTHLIVVSCTGMYAPGLDIELIKALGLPTQTERTQINFMGCYAAFNGLKTARQILKAEPQSRVLLVCIEMCSLHFQQNPTDDNLLANTLFADGAAALLLSTTHEEGSLSIEAQYADLIIEGERDMAWSVADFGFEMRLTSYIPHLLENGLAKMLGQLTEKLGLSEHADFFAIHPGGKRILEAMKQALSLTDDDLQYSTQILEHYGNMSSPTVLFVLDLIRQSARSGQTILGMAFGPGLTLESMVFKKS